jgi:membrane protease YdiL (CAAX protease family)
MLPEPDHKRRPGTGEPLLAYAAAIALAVTLFWLSRQIGFVQQIMQGAIACAFLFGPQLAARMSGRPFDPQSAGITVHPIGRGLRVLALALAVTWPAFILGFFAYYQTVCPSHAPLHALARNFAPACSEWHGLAGWHFRLPDDFLVLALAQILVVAVPEEIFFRGYLLSRFEERWPSKRRFFGAAVGRPLLLTSALFALGHFLVDLQPVRLAVFFPALAFGWMRARSGSIAPAAVFHALCNLLSEIMHDSFF